MRVALHDVGHRFGEGSWLFRHIDLELRPGGVYALTGPSGSGKSTLLSLLAGWDDPSEGRIVREHAGRTGWVFQNPHGAPRRSALDHVAFPLLAQGASPQRADAIARQVLRRFGLSEVATRPFCALSGGEAQRLMLARGIASKPSLFLVDEPTAQLDLETAEEVNAALTRLASEDTIVVVATHDDRTREACSDQLDLRRFQSGYADSQTELP